MIEILQWSTLAVCGVLTAARIPSALRGDNRVMFGILLLMTLATLLSIEVPYLAVDQVLGSRNLANLVLRFIIFGAILLMGIRLARGFAATRALKLITGWAGATAFALASVAVVVTYLMMDAVGSSAGLIAVSAKDSRHAALVEYYGAAGRLYPSYVSLVLVPAMVRTFLSRLPALIRAAALLLSVGAIGTAVSLLSPVVPPGMEGVRFIVNYTAILCYVVGLALIWAAKLQARPAPPRQREPLSTAVD
jgi:hypothetical protein